jgi:hypothetical protein
MNGASEQFLVALIALALLPAIGWRIWRGLSEGKLPVYRTYLRREESDAKFALLLVLHSTAFVLIALAAADLLGGLGIRSALGVATG